MNKKKFLKSLSEAVKKLKCRPVLDDGHWLRFILRGDKDHYEPIALVCAYLKQRYYPNEFKKSAELIKISIWLRNEINRAAFRHPIRYDWNLRRQLMRAAGLWK